MPRGPRWLYRTVSQGAWVLVVALVLASAFGLFRAARDGRFRGTHQVKGVDGEAKETIAVSVLEDTDIDHRLGERATLLQFSSAFCAPCRVTRRVLTDVASVVPGVTHVEIDAEHHLDLVRRLGITRTPTTLVLDAHGREVSRASGAPRKEEVLATLARGLDG
jgi:thiol-disulfide isomerase/thioredoxin